MSWHFLTVMPTPGEPLQVSSLSPLHRWVEYIGKRGTLQVGFLPNFPRVADPKAVLVVEAITFASIENQAKDFFKEAIGRGLLQRGCWEEAYPRILKIESQEGEARYRSEIAFVRAGILLGRYEFANTALATGHLELAAALVMP